MNYRLLKGCLCWFWNNESSKKIGIFVDYFQDEDCPEMTTFYELNGGCYKYCEPAKYKDIMFYEDNPMKQVYLSAKEKAEQGILDAVEEYFKEALDYYKDEFLFLFHIL